MALLWVEGFDWIEPGITGTPLVTTLLRRYQYQDMLYSTSDGLTAVGAHGLGTSLNRRRPQQYIETPALLPSDTEGTWIVGLRVTCRNLIFSDYPILYFLNSQREGNGEFYKFVDGTLRFTPSSVYALLSNRLGKYRSVYLELKVYVHDTEGTVEIRENGEQLLLAEGLDTKIGSPTGFDRVRFYGWGLGGDCLLDDIYICQGDGIDFLGPVRVLHLKPAADTADEDWALSVGSDSHDLVNEDEVTDDDGYIYDSTLGNRTLFTYESVPSGMGDNIKGVQLCTAACVDGGALDLIQQVKSGGTLYPRTAQNIASGTFTQIQDLMETDPDTDNPWSSSGLNAAQFGVEVG